jgi:hypothetical protein
MGCLIRCFQACVYLGRTDLERDSVSVASFGDANLGAFVTYSLRFRVSSIRSDLRTTRIVPDGGTSGRATVRSGCKSVRRLLQCFPLDSNASSVLAQSTQGCTRQRVTLYFPPANDLVVKGEFVGIATIR